MSTHPEVLWAQRSSISTPEKNVVYLTVNLPDINESTLHYNLTTTSLSFEADAGPAGQTKKFAFSLDFFAEVDHEKSTSRLTSRSFAAVLRKKELKSEYWPRVTKEKIKTAFIKTDFSKWVDEDEQDGSQSTIVPDDDFGGGGGFQGMGGGDDFDFAKMMQQSGDLGGAQDPDDEVDSDNDAPPPLEDFEQASK